MTGVLNNSFTFSDVSFYTARHIKARYIVARMLRAPLLVLRVQIPSRVVYCLADGPTVGSQISK
jgi:hypothetical protein